MSVHDRMTIVCQVCKMYGAKSTCKLTDTIHSKNLKNVFWDEDGKKHIHNASWNRQTFLCSNGHVFEITNESGPCWCGWRMDAII